jgi:hypothetical protein
MIAVASDLKFWTLYLNINIMSNFYHFEFQMRKPPNLLSFILNLFVTARTFFSTYLVTNHGVVPHNLLYPSLVNFLPSVRIDWRCTWIPR